MSNESSPTNHDSGDGAVELVIIGGGNMGAALLGGLLESSAMSAADVAVVELDADRRSVIGDEYGVGTYHEVPPNHSAIIAVKPQHVAEAVRAAAAAGASRLVSIAAGITTEALSAAAGEGVAIVRAMPNTPALVGAGVTAICAGPGATDDDLDWADGLLSGVGLVVRVDEDDIDAVTGLTGSGPAYVFRLAESLVDAGHEAGLPAELVEPMVVQLFVGSARLLADRGDPRALRLAVTSPGGTTERGVATLDERGVPGAVIAAVLAATERSRELGASSG